MQHGEGITVPHVRGSFVSQPRIWESLALTNALFQKLYCEQSSTLPKPHPEPRRSANTHLLPFGSGSVLRQWEMFHQPVYWEESCLNHCHPYMLSHWLLCSEKASLITFTNTSGRPLSYQSQKIKTSKAAVAKTNLQRSQKHLLMTYVQLRTYRRIFCSNLFILPKYGTV